MKISKKGGLLVFLILLFAGLSYAAVEADLAEYPNMFSIEGKFDGSIVLGGKAPPEDLFSAIDITASLRAIFREMPAAKLDSEIENLSTQNLITVGHPCNNSISNHFLDCEDWNLAEGQAMIKFYQNNGKIALLVAGTYPSDTRRAATVLKNFKDYDLAGEEVCVTRTNLTDISVRKGSCEEIAEVKDILEEGRTRTYTLADKDYKVEVVIIADGDLSALFKVNEELTSELSEGEHYILADGTNIVVDDIIVEGVGEVVGDQVEFRLTTEYLGPIEVFPCDIKDLIEPGGTKFYTLDGKGYEVEATFIGGTPIKARFKVNWEVTEAMEENEQDVLPDGNIIKIIHLMDNEAGEDIPDMAVFCLNKGIVECTDSDGGKNYYVKGQTTSCVGDICELGGLEGCIDDMILWESYCGDENEIVWVEYICPYGCKNGACIPEYPPLDVVPDNCIDTKDLAQVAKCYEASVSGDCARADINKDGNIDANDYNLVYAQYQIGLEQEKEPGDLCEGWRCMAESCNGIDDDCDVLYDEDFDNDGDKYTTCGTYTLDGSSVQADCNDNNAAINPRAAETCDGIDNNCNRAVDEGFPNFDRDSMADCVDPDDDNDGVLDEQDRCPGTPLGAVVDSAGCPICEDGTKYGKCSANKPKFCDYGVLVDRCDLCGCPEAYIGVCTEEETKKFDKIEIKRGDPCKEELGHEWSVLNYSKVEIKRKRRFLFFKKRIRIYYDIYCYKGIRTPCSSDPVCPADTSLIAKIPCELYLCQYGLCKIDRDRDGYSIEVDCNDNNPNIYPGAKEICDGKDDNCDGRIPKEEMDSDKDGYMVCQGDCNDNDPTIYPGAQEFCDGKDNDCDREVDTIDGRPLHYINYGKKTYKICIKGEWFERPCAAREDCSNKIDNDCDYQLPEHDWDCVRRGWTKPASDWEWWWKRKYYIKYTCGASAWNIPDYEYNPAKHSLMGMNPYDWRCYAEKTYYGDAVSNLGGMGISIKKIGELWLLDHVTGLAAFIRLFISSRVGKYIPRAEPSAWTYIIKGYCVDWDTAYSFKRDWVCYHWTFPIEKIFDWRNKDGKNWMTPVQAQSVDHKGDYHPCGSCWAFSALGAVEAQHNIKNKDPNLDINLAEQELVSCEGGGGTCRGGSNSGALNYVDDKGILFENCFEYLGCKLWSYPEGKYQCDEEYPCEPTCHTRHPIAGHEYIEPNREAIKFRLRTKGPISICMDWGGVISFRADGMGRCDYSHPMDQGHCVVLVGYNDLGGYWIIKNSWGTTWKNGMWIDDCQGKDCGYGKIGYGECKMETSRGSPTGVS